MISIDCGSTTAVISCWINASSTDSENEAPSIISDAPVTIVMFFMLTQVVAFLVLGVPTKNGS